MLTQTVVMPIAAHTANQQTEEERTVCSKVKSHKRESIEDVDRFEVKMIKVLTSG